jgi:MoaA/NifB/PqqE/SkfB family radical SAM enzyme
MHNSNTNTRIEIMLSWACNNNCIICGESDNKIKSIQEGDFYRSFESVFQDLQVGYTKGSRHVTFLGGEPTIYPHIFKVLAAAKRMGYTTRFLPTNARMCSNEAFTKKLVASGLTEVSVSLHGIDEKMHNAIVRADNAYQQTVQGLRNLLKYCPNVMSNTIINQINYKHLEEMVQFLNQFELKRILLTYPDLIGNAAKISSMIPTYTEVSPFIHKAIQATTKNIRVANIPFCFMQGYEKNVDSLGFQDRIKLSPHGATEKRYSTGNDCIKVEGCKRCIYDLVCPGCNIHYANIKGTNELNSIEGKKISPDVFNIENRKSESFTKKRVELNIGLLCNNNCVFCISGDKPTPLDKPEVIIKEIEKYSNKDIDLLNILGGEPTLIKELPEIIGKASQVGFKNIQIITNGRRLEDYDFTYNLIKNGLNRISITLHGHTPVLQDAMVQRDGAFNETVQGIINVDKARKALGKKVKLTCGSCVTEMNYMHIPDIAKLVTRLGADEYLMINLNPLGNCKENFEKVVPRYEEITPYLKKTSEYCNTIGIPVAFDGFAHCIIHEFAEILEEDFAQEDEVTIQDGDKRSTFDWIETRTASKTKIPECSTCIFNNRCEGIWKPYVEHYGTSDFNPIHTIQKRK